MENQKTETYFAVFQVGEEVKDSGNYVCVPCGFKKYFKKGDIFPNCISCIKDGRRKYAKNLELWEKVTDSQY